MSNFHPFWQKSIVPLYTKEQINARIQELGKEITRDFSGKSLTLIGILKGCFIFYADLVRVINLPIQCEFIGISSYGDDTRSSGVVRITQDLSTPIKDRDILIVEDIVDTGLTMRYLMENLKTRQPASIKICTFLHKPAKDSSNLNLDYIGFRIPDRFVIGYGLDLAEKYRNMPFIGEYLGRN